jgi:hypothetical protein
MTNVKMPKCQNVKLPQYILKIIKLKMNSPCLFGLGKYIHVQVACGAMLELRVKKKKNLLNKFFIINVYLRTCVYVYIHVDTLLAEIQDYHICPEEKFVQVPFYWLND